MDMTWEDDPSVTVSMKDIKVLIAEPGVLSKYHLCGHGCGQSLEE